MGASDGVGLQLVDDVAHDAARVVAVGGDAALREVVELVGAEDVERLEVLLEVVDHGAEEADQQRQEGEDAGHLVVFFLLLFFLFCIYTFRLFFFLYSFLPFFLEWNGRGQESGKDVVGKTVKTRLKVRLVLTTRTTDQSETRCDCDTARKESLCPCQARR